MIAAWAADPVRAGLVLAALLTLSFLFSGTETALLSLQTVDRQRMASGSASERQVAALLERPTSTTTSILLGSTAVNLTFVAFAALVIAPWAPDQPWLVVPFAWLVLAVAGEITPKVLAFRFNHRWARLAVFPLAVWHWLVGPARVVIHAAARGVARLFGAGEQDPSRALHQAELRTLVDRGAESGHLDAQEQEIIQAVFDFHDLTVGRLMTPTPDLFAVAIDITWHDLVEACREAGYSRIPVHGDDSDDIIGVLLLKDLLNLQDDPPPTLRKVRAILRPPTFVPVSKPADAMMREFLEKRVHMAFVVDEHGTLMGLVTLDDLLAELVGTPADDGEEPPGIVHHDEDGAWTVAAMMDAEDFEEETGIELPEGEYHTVGGFVLHQIGRLPRIGDTLEWGGHRFLVGRVTNRRIEEIHLEPIARESA